MKTWKAFGSAHSAHLTIIGQFRDEEDAMLIRQVVEHFVNEAFEEHPNPEGFYRAWESKLGGITMLGPHPNDFELGVDDTCDVTREGTRVLVSHLRAPTFNGIIRLMLLKDPTEIKITGRTGP